MDLITPIININGSTAESLIEQRLKVCQHLDNTLEAMFNGMPHGRDYQTCRDALTCTQARDAWKERIEMLRRLRNDIMSDAEAIRQQMIAKQKRSSDG